VDTQHNDDLVGFILRAKQATYVGSGKTLLPYRLGSHDLQYHETEWAYHDSYVGENDFMGEEVVYHKGKVVWGMNYYGRIIQNEKITSAQAGKIIQHSLTKLYQEGRFLGGFINTVNEYTYRDTNQGDARYFTGKEWIEVDGEVVYSLDYHGGLIRE
jgi:hypothetical protein